MTIGGLKDMQQSGELQCGARLGKRTVRQEKNNIGAVIRSFFNALKVENLTFEKNCDIIIV
jgi:hypothetical protein